MAKRKKEKIPAPGSKGEKSTSFYTKKKWRTLLQYSLLDVSGRALDGRGGVVLGNALAKNRYVTKLDLSNNELGDGGAVALADMLRVNTVLQTLNLSCNGITDIGGIALASAFIPNVSATGQPGQWNRTLFTLILTGNDLGDDTLLAMSNAAACHRDLTCIDLSWNSVGPQGTKCLMRCFQRNPLCNFVLAANHIGDEGTVFLCDALKRYGGRSQTTLNLYRNDVSHRGAAAIGSLLASTDIVQEVNLSGNTLGLKGIQELRQHLIGSPCAVRMLHLGDNLIGDAGAKEVAAIIEADLPCLERLDLSDNGFTDVGATAVAKALLRNTKLQVVSCSGNSFGSKAVAAVEDLIRQTKTLKSLNLSHCVEAASHRRSLALLVGESDGMHVEMGQGNEDTDSGENEVLNKLEEYLQMRADQIAQQKAKEAETKKSRKKKKKASTT